MGMLPRARPASTFLRVAPFTEPVSSATGTGQSFVSVRVVLLRQHLGGRHQRGLRAGLDGAEHGAGGDQRLARADIALQQAQHPAGCGEVGVDFGDRGELAHGGREAEAGERLAAQRAVAGERAAGPHPLARAQPGDGDLARQQLVIGEPAARRLGHGQSGGAWIARSAAPKPGHFSRRSSAGSCHSGSSGMRSSAARTALPSTLGQSPAVIGQTGSSARQLVLLPDGHDMVGMRHGRSALRTAPPCPRPRASRPSGNCSQALRAEEDELAEAAAVRDDHAPGLARVGGLLVAHHLDRDRRDLAGLRRREASGRKRLSI